MRFLLVIISFLLLNLNLVQAQKANHTQLRNGDLLFQDLDCGPLCDAIEQVTLSYGGRHFSHIGLVSIDGDSVYIIEAIGNKVQLTPLHLFVGRTKKEILLGRVKRKFKNVAIEAVVKAKQKIDIPYDDAFLYDNGKYYCSELLYDAFKEANQNQDFFLLSPMTFKRPGSNDFFPVWIDYYEKLNIPIPEGKAGINPGGISLSPRLKMYRYKK